MISDYCPQHKLATNSEQDKKLHEKISKGFKETVYSERGAVQVLLNKKSCLVHGIGNSMTPILKSGEVVRVNPITEDTVIKKGDIVLCRVNRNTYLHKVTGIKGNQYQISNNHGHVNGWTTKVYGKVQPE